MPSEGLHVAALFQNLDGVGGHLDYFVIRFQYRGQAAGAVPEGAIPEQLRRPAFRAGFDFDCFDLGPDLRRDQ